MKQRFIDLSSKAKLINYQYMLIEELLKVIENIIDQGTKKK